MAAVKKYILIVLSLVIAVSSMAQPKAQKPSAKKGSTANYDRTAIAQKFNYAEQIFDDSIKAALQIVETNLLICIEQNFKIEEALGYQTLGKFNHQLNNYTLAIAHFEKAIKIHKKDNAKLFELYNLKAASEQKNNNVNEAIASYKKALTAVKKSKSDNRVFETEIKLGKLLLTTTQPQKAEAHFNNALENAASPKTKIEAKIGLGKLLEINKATADAEHLYKEAQAEAQQNNLDQLSNEAFDLLTALYSKQNNIARNIQVQEEAFNFNNARGNSNSAILNSNNLANTYMEQGKAEEAVEILKETAPLVAKEENTEEKRTFIKTLTQVYEKQGEQEKAKELTVEYEVLMDSFLVAEEEKELAIQSKNEALAITQDRILLLEKDRELSEKTIQLLEKEQIIKNDTIKRQRTITYLLLGGLLIIMVMAFFIYRNNKQKQISNQLLALKSMRNQMNPHFIFNSLNSVNSFIAIKDEKSANKYLSEFSKLMREVLEYSQQDFISLAKEIEILRLYLNLEHFRFKNDFEYAFNVDPKLKVDDYQIPPMLIQPFVENAIWHGLRYEKNKGKLDVNFVQKDNHVEITIADNGIGREKSQATKTMNQKKMKSTGIENVKNRLEIIKEVFKKDLAITINDLDEISKKGTLVTIKLHA